MHQIVLGSMSIGRPAHRVRYRWFFDAEFVWHQNCDGLPDAFIFPAKAYRN
jgi:hypothetical protein